MLAQQYFIYPDIQNLSFNQTRHGRLYTFKYSQILGCHNNWIIMIFEDVTNEEEYEHINRTIIDGNMVNISVIIMEGNFGAIGADDSTCHG